MDIGSIRRANMLRLIKNFRTQSDFADAVGKPASYISQIKKGTKTNGDAVSMGSEFARDIEQSLGLSHGWMDTIDDKDEATNEQSPSASSAEVVHIGGKSAYPLVHVKYLDIKASCGSGYVNEQYPAAHTQLFTVEFLRENDLPIDGKGLVLMHACSHSMGHTIPHGTLMLVNTNESEFDNFTNDKVYVFNADGEMICKRAIKNLNGTVILKSDNPDKNYYPDQVVSRDTFTQFKLFGRVRYTFMKL